VIVVECNAPPAVMAELIGCEVEEVKSVPWLGGKSASEIELEDDVPESLLDDLRCELVSMGLEVYVWSVGLTDHGEREWPGKQR
jgi:hypothetical protein